MAGVDAAVHNPRMPDAFAALLSLTDQDLQREVAGYPVWFHLSTALRREQRAVVATRAADGREPVAIMSFARSAYHELVTLLTGRDVLDTARDGEWTLRDLLRHAIAVEFRYREQAIWSATRGDDDPLPIPEARLPCDRLTPPEPANAETKVCDQSRILEILGRERDRTDERLGTFGPDALARPSVWGSAVIDVRDRMHQIGVHTVDVVMQTEKMLGIDGSDARRVVRRIAATRGLHEALSDPATIARLDEQLAWIAQHYSDGKASAAR